MSEKKVNEEKEQSVDVPSVRERVVKHLVKLLAGTALAGLAGSATGCVCDPLPPPPPDGQDINAGDPMVCDPLPPPDGGDAAGGDNATGDRGGDASGGD